MGTTPGGIVYPDPSAVPSRQALEDLAVSVDSALETVVASVAATAPFTTTAVVERTAGGLVTMRGGFTRAGWSSSTFEPAGLVPEGFRPITSITYPGMLIFSDSALFQMAVSSAGVVSLRLATASASTMIFGSVSWAAAP